MIIYLVIILAVISRFMPHIPNFAPITALAIFAAANMDLKKAAGITLAARLVSDLFIGFVAWPMMLAIYASHLVGVLFGVWIKRGGSVIPETRLVRRSFLELRGLGEGGSEVGAHKRVIRNLAHIKLDPGSEAGMTNRRWFRIIASSLAASAIFFLVTNFAFLYSNYPHNFSGIIQSYINGLPFLRGTLMGDMFYSLALFGAYDFVKFWKARKSQAKFLIPNS